MRTLMVIIVVVAAAVAAWFSREHWLSAPPPVTAQRDAPVSSPTAANGIAPSADVVSPSPAADSALPADTPAADSALAADTPVVDETRVQRQAERYVARLTEPEAEPVRVERADHFVTGAQVLSLIPEAAVETTSIEQMRADPTLTADTPITVVRQVEQIERITPEKLIARSSGQLDAPIQVLVRDEVKNTTVREVLEQASREPDTPIDLITQTRYFEQTTPRELQEQGGDVDEPVRMIRKHHGLETSSITNLMRSEEDAEGSMFYVRTVRPGDDQGIWGIVHDGIIDNFARGMAIRRGRTINTYQVDIPRDADERRADQTSSFLGKLIFEKTLESHVYNFNQNRMGRNPDRIFPGQEIVIINFQAEELIEIYRHFVERSG